MYNLLSLPLQNVTDRIASPIWVVGVEGQPKDKWEVSVNSTLPSVILPSSKPWVIYE